MKKRTNLFSIPDADAPRSFYRRLYKIFAAPVRFFLRIYVRGSENIPVEGGALVCANHISNWDSIVLGAVFPENRPLASLAKAELYKIPVLRSIIHNLGAIPIQRGTGDIGAIKSGINAISGGRLLLLFPQGHRLPGKNPVHTEIRHGAGLIIYRAKCPAIPVSISMKKMRYFPFRKVYVNIGQPLNYDEFCFTSQSPEQYKKATEIIFSHICSLGGFLTAPKEETDENHNS